MFQIHQFPCLSDNYGFLAHDSASGETAAIDTPDAEKYLAEAASRGWTITQIWNTHWHPDHAGTRLAISPITCQKKRPPLSAMRSLRLAADGCSKAIRA